MGPTGSAGNLGYVAGDGNVTGGANLNEDLISWREKDSANKINERGDDTRTFTLMPWKGFDLQWRSNYENLCLSYCAMPVWMSAGSRTELETTQRFLAWGPLRL